MKPDERDLAYLWDMLDAAQRIVRLTAEMEYAAFVNEERHSEIPWQGIIGMRNVLAHQYGVVDQRKVWQAAKDGIAKLIPMLEACTAYISSDIVPPGDKAGTK